MHGDLSTAKLSEIAETLDYGITASATWNPIGPKFLRITDIRDGRVDWAKVPWCTCDSRAAARSQLQPGDIVFARTGSTGSSFLISDCPRDSVFASYLIRLRLRDDVDPRYVAHFFQTPDYWAQVKGKSRGAIQSGVNASSLRELKIPLLPLPDQRRIAEVLDRAEALRAKRREALAQLDELTQSIFLDMFGSATDEAWPVKTIEDVAQQRRGSIRTGPFGSQLLHGEFVEDGVAVLGIDNAVNNNFTWAERRFITEGKYHELKRYTVYPKDVLITIMGTCGRCAIVPADIPTAINTKHLCCITLDADKCLPEFMHAYFLQHPAARNYLNRVTKGSIMSGLNMGIIKSTPIPVPPLSLQHEFVCRVGAVEELKVSQRKHLTELDALFASLQQRAFRGEL